MILSTQKKKQIWRICSAQMKAKILKTLKAQGGVGPKGWDLFNHVSFCFKISKVCELTKLVIY
jgi:hypothetical protein